MSKRTFRQRNYPGIAMRPYIQSSKARQLARSRAGEITYGSIARGRRRLNSRVAGLLGIEMKYLDVWASLVAVPTPTDCSGGEMQPEGGCTSCLSAPAQGDGAQNRDGRAIQAKSVFVTGAISFSNMVDQADAKSAPLIFVALVLDTQANGSTIVSEQVFTNPNDTAAVNAWPLRNIEYSSRYKVLAHTTVVGWPVVEGTDGASTMSMIAQAKSFMLSWKGELPIRFTSGTTADVANVENNAIHLIAFSTSSNFTPQLSFNSRMRFVG